MTLAEGSHLTDRGTLPSQSTYFFFKTFILERERASVHMGEGTEGEEERVSSRLGAECGA